MGKNTSARGANVNILANELDLIPLDGIATIAADNGSGTLGTVTINRVTDGTVSLGSAAAAASATNMQLTQLELNRIFGKNLVVGSDDANNKITGINVNGANTQATITQAVSLNALRADIDGLPGAPAQAINANHVNLQGTNAFNGLNIKADDGVNVQGTTTSNGNVVITTDTNGEGVGLFFIDTNGTLQTSDDDVTINTHQVQLNTGSKIDAAGGNILLNNDSIFNGAANSLRTTGDGKITLNVWDAAYTAVSGPFVGVIGSVQNAISALQNTGSGLNTLFLKNGAASAGGGIAAGNSTFVENVTVDQANTKLDGDAGITIAAASNANNAVINVTANNVNVDPIIIDGNNLVNYGISATGAGFTGFVSDGNTFRETLVAGVQLNGTSGTATVKNNFFEGTATRGVDVTGLTGATTVALVENNDMGVVGGSVVNGVRVTNGINDATLAIQLGNDIRSTGDGVLVNGAIANTANLTVNENSIRASGGHGVNVTGNMANSLVIINGNTLIDAEQDGVRFGGTMNGGFVQVSQNAKIDADDSGIWFEGAISNGAVINMHDNVINANLDGGIIGSGIFFNGTVDGSTINIGDGNNVPGPGDDGSNIINVLTNFGPPAGPDDGLDGIHFDKNVNNSTVLIDGNRIGYTGLPGVGPVVQTQITDDGIEFTGNVTGNTNVTISDNRISAFDNGVLFNGNVGGGGVTRVTIGGQDAAEHGNLINASGDGVRFNGLITGEALIEISNNIINAQRDGILFNGAINNAKTTGGLSEEEIHIFKNDITGAQNGINFASSITSPNNDVRIHTNNGIRGNNGQGIRFGGAINDADVRIDGNGTAGDVSGSQNGILFAGAIENNAQVDVTNNQAVIGGDDGVHFEGAVTNSVVNVNGNTVRYGANPGDRGIEFVSGITGNSVVNINSNTIDPTTSNTGDDGILINVGISGSSAVTISGNSIALGLGFAGATPDEVGAAIDIESITGTSTLLVSNNTFEGHHDGLQVDGLVNTTSTALAGGYGVLVTGNTLQALNRHGIEFAGAITGAKVGINDNPLINLAANPAAGFGLNGIHFAGPISGGAQVDVLRNAAINAQNHGVYFGGTINGTTLNIHDNNIQADLNNSGGGDGIRFDGAISNASVNIGDGSGATVNVDASNVISGADGIRFAANVGDNAIVNIDGNRIGYSGTAAAPTTGAGARVSDDGIDFATLSDDADINITDNWIRANDDGIVFNNNVDDFVNVLIGGLSDANTIDAANGGNGNGIVFEGTVEDQALLEISYNTVNADQDGILFQGQTSNALLPAGASQQEIFINENTITGGNHGIRFAQNVSEDLHDIRITGNTIDGQNEDGIHFAGSIDDESQIWILNNDSITGDRKGIYVNGTISEDALFEVVDNTYIRGEDEDGIDFNGNIFGDAVVRVNGNDHIQGADNGIEFAGVGGNATVEILNNNHGIHSNNHGIYFGGAIGGAADLDIHDNIINADDNNNGSGDGIHFAGNIENQATVNIGDGNGANEDVDGSNIISGHDGIHFAGNIQNQAQIVIDGNRLGFDGASVAGPYSNDRLGDDGIQVEGELRNQASFVVTDNHIRAEGDGISLLNNLENDAFVLIGGVNDGNTINANDDGVQFEGNILNSSLVEISHNNILSNNNSGIVFNGNTSNADGIFPFRDDEILIADNDIEADEYGIVFFGQASGERHDIMIRDNDQIHGHGEHGIAHFGGIDDAELRILDNDDIFGETDGIHIAGAFTNDALIRIDDNTIDTNDGDGVEVTQSGGSGGVDLNITDNHIHFVGDNGIEVTNVDDGFIAFNEIHDTDADGIRVQGSEDTQIRWNYIHSIGDDGVDLRDSDGSNIENNFIWFTSGDGIQVRDSNGIIIDDNFIRFAGDDGIDYEDGFVSAITDNNIRFANHNGIEVNDSALILIDGNTVRDADEAGIFIDPSTVIFVTNNLLTSNDIGLYVQGPNNGYINVTGNTFTNNRVGLRAESGIIDLTGISSDPGFGPYGNKFIGGQHGMEFDAWAGRPDQLSLVRTGGIFAGGYTYDGNPFDTFDGVSIPGSPALNFGGTIGSQYFEGQTTSFVTLRSDTFVDPRGRAIWLDASDSTFFMPGPGGGLITGDVLTQAQFDFLESMFRHWPDANNRGIFWFGAVPDSLGLENDKDFFEDFDPFNGGVSGLNVTITGLPRISGFAPASTGAAGLNAIAPAAGDETPADLANIEPAAGGEGGQNVSCWGDAVNAAGTGGPVNYSYGGTFEESIAAAASCGAQSF
jgi:hypothetical protein